MNTSPVVNSEDLVKAYQISAKLVAAYGRDFVPAFERMERELDRSKELEGAIERAKREAKAQTEQ